MSKIKIIGFPVSDSRQVKSFISFPLSSGIYAGDSNYIPPLRVDIEERLNPAKNPFFKHGKMRLFLAEDGGRLVGRVSAQVDYQFVSYQGKNTGFFGFFESINDIEVSNALLKAASGWLKAHGMDDMIGPMCPSMSEEIGILVEGFAPATILTSYNPLYYANLFTSSGFEVVKTWYAWRVETKDFLNRSERFERMFESLKKRNGIEIRKVNMKQFYDELKIIRYLWNECWKDNWGFTPLTEEDINYIGEKLKDLVVEDLALFVYKDGKPVGVSITLPDLNQAIKDFKGELNLINMIKLFYRLKVKPVKTLRVLILGVLEEYRHRGLDALLYIGSAEAALKKGYIYGEASMILEDNWGINNAIKNLGGVPYKKFYIFGRNL